MNNNPNKLLGEALEFYNFENAKVEFIRHDENMTYSVEHNDRKYIFRIHTETDGLDFSFYLGDFSRKTLICMGSYEALGELFRLTQWSTCGKLLVERFSLSS